MKILSRIENWIVKQYVVIILFIITIIGFILRFYNLQNYSFWNDELISIEAAKGILNNGTPIMPDGTIYFKSTLHIYSLALPLKIFGINEFSTRIISVIYGTLTIILIYFVAQKISGNNKLIGLSAALIYSLSIWSIAWSREVRFYQQFQFFSLLTIYCFWLGFIENRTEEESSKLINLKYFMKYKYIILSIIFFILTMLSSKLAIILIPPLILAIIIIKGKKSLLKPVILISIIIMILSWIFYQSMPIIFSFDTKNPFMEANLVGFSFESLYKNLIGFGFFLIKNPILNIFVFIGIFIRKWRQEYSFWFLYSFLFLVSAILIANITTPVFRSRYYYFIFPILIIIACTSALYFSEIVMNSLKDRRMKNRDLKSTSKNELAKNEINPFKNRVGTKFKIFFILIILILLVDSKVYVSHRVSTDPYSGTQLTIFDVQWHPDYKRSCEYIQNNYQPGDCVLAKKERVVDFYLNEFLEDENNIENYIVIAYNDLNLSEIQNIFNSYRVWVLFGDPIESQIPRFISQDEYDFIENNTRISFKSKDQYTTLRLENQ